MERFRLNTRLLMIFISLLFCWATSNFAEEPPVASADDGIALLEAEHVLSDEEIGHLAANGIVIIRPLGGSHYLVTSTPRSMASVETLPVVRLSSIPVEEKLLAPARNELARDGGSPALRIFFVPGTPFEQALMSMEEAGAQLVRPRRTDFDVFDSIEAFVPRGTVSLLLRDQRILAIGASAGTPVPMNRFAGQMTAVAELYEPVYDLTGAGIVVTMTEPGKSDRIHPEFQDRVTSDSFASVSGHATHVVGTIAAAGLRENARGMAPEARVHHPGGRPLPGEKLDETTIRLLGELDPASHNESIGYIGGWEGSSQSDTAWTWAGFEPYGYTFESALADRIARGIETLFVYSANNSANENGPDEPPWAHYHGLVDSDGLVYCYSVDGSGSDCTDSRCDVCETTRHPPDGPFGSVSVTSQAKNVVAVGATNKTSGELSEVEITSFSARGPTDDGRIKPDLVAPGRRLYSTFEGNRYGSMSGTSVSAPVVSGIAALVAQQWKRTFGNHPPSDVMKALLINSALDLGNAGPDYTYGFGLVQARPAVDLIREDAGTGRLIRSGDVRHGEVLTQRLEVSEPPGRLTLVWHDLEQSVFRPNTGRYSSPVATLINDLDLEILDGSGAVLHPLVLDPDDPEANGVPGRNDRDNVEQIDELDAGVYWVKIRGHSVASGPQRYALVSNSPLGEVSSCRDPYEPNDSIELAWTSPRSGATIDTWLCETGDVDFYAFKVARRGEVEARVESIEGELRIELYLDGSLVRHATVAPGEAAKLSVSHLEEQTIGTYAVAVSSTDGIGRYLIRFSYPEARRRGARR